MKVIVGAGEFTPMQADPDMELPEALQHTFRAIAMIVTTLDDKEH